MVIQPIKTRIFKEGENIVSFICDYVPKLENKTIIVISSKIVALAEGRTAKYLNQQTKERLIRSESSWVRRTKYVYLTVRDGLYTANAGIDESNGNGRLVLLPKDCFQSANAIRRKLLRHYKIKNLGVIITDSRTLPLRAGVLGIALGYAGIKGLRDYRGQKDIFGRKFKFAKTDVADSLATAATLEMGEGSERQPLALISQASVKFVNRTNTKELLINPKDDMFIPLLPGRFD